MPEIILKQRCGWTFLNQTGVGESPMTYAQDKKFEIAVADLVSEMAKTSEHYVDELIANPANWSDVCGYLRRRHFCFGTKLLPHFDEFRHSEM